MLKVKCEIHILKMIQKVGKYIEKSRRMPLDEDKFSTEKECRHELYLH